MSYIERKQINGKNYEIFIKKTRLSDRKFVVKESMGKDLGINSKENYILENLNKLVEKEMVLKEEMLKKVSKELSFNKNLIFEIERKSIKINYLIEAKKSQRIIDLKFAEEFIFNSNNIEGSKIPKEKVLEIIEKGITKYFNKNEVKEVENSIKAFKYIKEEFKFNISSIKRLYYILTKDLFLGKNLLYPKGFKDIENVINNQITTKPKDVEREIKELLSEYLENKKKTNPWVLAFDFHKRYETIHPFLDANGRTGRLIMNKVLMANNYFPIIIFKENKESYFNALSSAREGRNKKYYQFMLEQANKTYDLILQILK